MVALVKLLVGIQLTGAVIAEFAGVFCAFLGKLQNKIIHQDVNISLLQSSV